MLRIFSFLPPAGLYVLAAATLAGTFFIQEAMVASNPEVDVNKIWLVGGLLAFLLGFNGFQKSMEARDEANTPRVSSLDVLQKLTQKETGTADSSLDVPPPTAHGPDADSPLGRLRARSEPLEHL